MKKFFSKVIAFTLALINVCSFCATAGCLPKGSYRVFNVAVIGSDITGEKSVEQCDGFNEKVINSLCNIGTKLESFSDVEVLNDNIIISGHEVPRSSIILLDKHMVFCFHDVSRCSPEVIKECQYAICPYTVNLKEDYGTLKARMIRLRDFVKKQNYMCDLRFLGIVKKEDEEKEIKMVGEYILKGQDIASHEIDNCKYQQTVNTSWIDRNRDYSDLIKSLVKWDREKEFKKYTGKSLPTLTCDPAIEPIFAKEGEHVEYVWRKTKQENQVPESSISSKESTTSKKSKKNLNKSLITAISMGLLAILTGITSYLVKMVIHLKATKFSKRS